jgi:hypothetical protein
MNEGSSDRNCRIAFFVSIAANIFLVAFALGRLGPSVMPPHPEQQGIFQAGMMPDPPPPAFGLGDLFEPNEIRIDEMRMRKNFEDMDALRKAFAAQLQAGPVGKEDALKHFAAIDQIMDGVKKEAQERATDKISSMTKDERQRFARILLSREREPFGEHRREPK